jgi:hypothetical protein
MSKNLIQEIVFRIITRAETTLYFIEDFLFHHNAKDGAYFRSLLILFSYCFELILKAKIVLLNNFKKEEEIQNKLLKYKHNLDQLAHAIGEKELNAIGIKNITKRIDNTFVGYIITTTEDKKIIIENFIDVRYDFLRPQTRSLVDHVVVHEYVGEIQKIIKKIKLNLNV